MVIPKNSECGTVGSTDRASSQQLQMWLSEPFFGPELAAYFVTPIVFATVEEIWRENISEKPHSIRLMRWLNFSQSGSRKNNRKAFEGASMGPTTIYVDIRLQMKTMNKYSL